MECIRFFLTPFCLIILASRLPPFYRQLHTGLKSTKEVIESTLKVGGERVWRGQNQVQSLSKSKKTG